jgi:hypothetical protein
VFFVVVVVVGFFFNQFKEKQIVYQEVRVPVESPPVSDSH